MSKFTKGIAIAMLGAAVLTGAYFTNTAYAGNINNSVFDFALGNRVDPLTDPARQKNDDSSVYMKVQSITNKKEGDYFDAWVVDGDGIDFSLTKKYQIFNASTTPIYMINYAYEQRGPGVYVKIKTWSAYRLTYTWHATGVWSPDSVPE